MAKEIVVLCDKHMETDERRPASTQTIGFESRKWTLDLCQDCIEEYVSPLLAMAIEHGMSVGGRQATAAPAASTGERRKGQTPSGDRLWACLFCDLDYASTSGLCRHIQKVHGVGDGKTLEPIFGHVCPICEHQGIGQGQHAQRRHDLPNVSAAFQFAAAGGDPHGIVAQKRSAASQQALAGV